MHFGFGFEHRFGHIEQLVQGHIQQTRHFLGGVDLHGLAVKRAVATLFELADLFDRQTSARRQVAQSPTLGLTLQTQDVAIDGGFIFGSHKKLSAYLTNNNSPLIEAPFCTDKVRYTTWPSTEAEEVTINSLQVAVPENLPLMCKLLQVTTPST